MDAPLQVSSMIIEWLLAFNALLCAYRASIESTLEILPLPPLYDQFDFIINSRSSANYEKCLYTRLYEVVRKYDERFHSFSLRDIKDLYFYTKLAARVIENNFRTRGLKNHRRMTIEWPKCLRGDDPILARILYYMVNILLIGLDAGEYKDGYFRYLITDAFDLVPGLQNLSQDPHVPLSERQAFSRALDSAQRIIKLRNESSTGPGIRREAEEVGIFYRDWGFAQDFKPLVMLFTREARERGVFAVESADLYHGAILEMVELAHVKR